MKRIKQKIREWKANKKGALSILGVAAVIVACFIIAGLTSVVQRQYIVTEVRGIMDVAGVSALNAAVDREILRGDKFGYNKDKLLSTYREIINQRINTENHITKIEIMKTEVHYEHSPAGLGTNARPSDQLWLDSIIMIQIKSYAPFDVDGMLKNTYYDSKNNQTFSVTYNGKTEDGRIELIIRSVSRLVYR